MGRLRRKSPHRKPELRMTEEEARIMSRLFFGDGPRLSPEEFEIAANVGERSVDVTIRQKILRGELRAEDWKLDV